MTTIRQFEDAVEFLEGFMRHNGMSINGWPPQTGTEEQDED